MGLDMVTAQDAWRELVKDVLDRPRSEWGRLPMRQILDELQRCVHAGHMLPIEVDCDGCRADLYVLRTRQGRMTLALEVVGAGGERKVFEGAAYRHTSASGKRAQTRSVYMEDELWLALTELGPPARVAVEAIRAYLLARRPDPQPED